MAIKRRKVVSFHKVSDLPLSVIKGNKGDVGRTGPIGPIGLPGESGKDGKSGRDGKDGLRGERGPQGLPGRDGKDGESVELKDVVKELEKRPYPGGMTASVVYTAVTTTSFSVPSHNLIKGINIFGVSTGAPTTIYLPRKIDEGVLITIKDESSTAATNNITIEKLT